MGLASYDNDYRFCGKTTTATQIFFPFYIPVIGTDHMVGGGVGVYFHCSILAKFLHFNTRC